MLQHDTGSVRSKLIIMAVSTTFAWLSKLTSHTSSVMNVFDRISPLRRASTLNN